MNNIILPVVYLMLSLIFLSVKSEASTVPISFNDFYADASVVMASDGVSAKLIEDSVYPSVLLVNDPSFGDPNVIVAAPSTFLDFNFSFFEGANNDDEFRVALFDVDSSDVLEEYFIGESFNGLVSFELSEFSGRILGLQFELRSFDSLLNSTVEIFNAKLRGHSIEVSSPSSLYFMIYIWVGLLMFRGRHTATVRL